MKPSALILRTAGSNCDGETAYAFERAGFRAVRLHVNRLLENAKQLGEYQALAIPGGFSYGDDIAAGRIFANQITHHLHDAFHAFVAAGKPILGVCNGFQVLVKTDLLPGPLGGRSGQTCTLTNNDCGRFVDRWLRLAPRSGKCIWTAGVEPLDLPIAHGEGKFVPASEAVREALWANDQVALVYTKADGSAAGQYPDNPNGSVDDIAGVCDASGLVFGLMPHPERHTSPLQHPVWTRLGRDQAANNADGPGLQFFRNAFRHVTSGVGAGVWGGDHKRGAQWQNPHRITNHQENPVVNTLEYANQPAVGNLIADKRADGVTITILPSWRRAMGSIWIVLAYLPIAIIFFFLQLAGSRHGPDLTTWIVPTIFLLVGLTTACTKAISALRRGEYSADPNRLTFTRRRILDVLRHEWPRAHVADIRVDSVRIKGQPWARRCVVMRLTNGHDMVLGYGTRAELEFIRDLLREGLRLPPEPLGESLYPAGIPRWRKQRRLLPAGVIITIPPPFPLLPIGVAVLPGIGIGLLVEWFVSPKAEIFGHISESQLWPIASVLAIAGIFTIVCQSVAISFRRRVTIIIVAGKLELRETGLLPAHVEWPLQEVADFRVVPNPRRPHLASLEIVPLHREAITPLRNRSKLLVEWLVQSVHVASARANAVKPVHVQS